MAEKTASLEYINQVMCTVTVLLEFNDLLLFDAKHSHYYANAFSYLLC